MFNAKRYHVPKYIERTKTVPAHSWFDQSVRNRPSVGINCVNRNNILCGYLTCLPRIHSVILQGRDVYMAEHCRSVDPLANQTPKTR